MYAIILAVKNISTSAIVRFGNVLSSGSVIPKFKIKLEMEDITLTQEWTRYFMTVAEAAQLVIQAGAMGKTQRYSSLTWRKC